jgi:hypothetical protein
MRINENVSIKMLKQKEISLKIKNETKPYFQTERQNDRKTKRQNDRKTERQKGKFQKLNEFEDGN